MSLAFSFVVAVLILTATANTIISLTIIGSSLYERFSGEWSWWGSNARRNMYVAMAESGFMNLVLWGLVFLFQGFAEACWKAAP